MNSLEELNNYSATALDYEDARPSQVIFDRAYPLTAQDQELTIAATSVIPEPGINIVEIVNYQTANVRYRVTIIPGTANPLLGSTITWASLPSGANLTQVGNEYTITGIHSVQDWEDVKYFSWNLPATYASYPLWYLNVEIIYYDSALGTDIVKDWLVYDDRFYYVAILTGMGSVNSVVGVNSPASANLLAQANISADSFKRVGFSINYAASAVIYCLANVNMMEFQARADINSVVGVKSPANVNLQARSTITCALLDTVINLDPRTYLTDTYNLFFATNTPVVNTSSSLDVVNVTLSSSLGRWGTNLINTPSSTIVLNGTRDQVNAALLNVYFFPDRGQSANGNFTWTHRINGQLIFTATIALQSVISGYGGEVVQITSVGSNTWTPTFVQAYYGGLANVVLVGGGGGGQYVSSNVYYGGGGGGGQVLEYMNIPVLLGTNYTINIGAGGAPGSAGSTTSAFGYTSAGGNPGQAASLVNGNWLGGNGGTSGNNFVGGAGSNIQNTYPGSGGGGGAGGLGQAANGGTGGNGGLGRLSAIANQRYAGGGGGAGYSSSGQAFGYGSNGGGNGGQNGPITIQATNGTANTGGGGGAGAWISAGSVGTPGSGGSGLVYMRIHA